jgi:hypothetical protein
MDAAVAALIGAAIGTLGSLGSTWVQQRHQSRRERLKVAADLGLADYKETLELAKAQPGSSAVPPMSCFVAYHADILNALADGGLDTERLAAIDAKQMEVLRATAERRGR